MTDSDADTDTDTDTETESTTPSSNRAQQIVSGLRLAALVLVVVGFIGWLTEDAAFDFESPYTIAFVLGVLCAFVSIYLGIFLANRDE